ncbi:hypothetical protein BHE74_00029857 [Ensete ventricosum]|nr:hypothetical protein GW17_00000662 [Ensete ventricosum]RWW62989.1 hypothetical protein BHE74_00029857 [Ensete ventricosum]
MRSLSPTPLTAGSCPGKEQEEMMPKVQEEIYLEIDDEEDAEAASHNLGAPPAIGLASKAVMALVFLHLTMQR